MKDPVVCTLENGTAVVTLDAPGEKANILTADFLQALDRTAESLASTEGVRAAVVISAKKGGFVAGADIQAIAGVRDPRVGTELAREGQRVFARWAALPFPVVAAVHGHCLGGGTEFILACPYRIAASDAAISLPEVKLGIIPGFGGTQRLPRLIGIEASLDMILTGRTIRADKALRIGLVDRIAEGDLLTGALALAREVAEDPGKIRAKRELRRRGWRRRLLEGNAVGRAVLFRLTAKRIREKTGEHYPAPLKALEVIREGYSRPLESALELEARELGPLLVSETCKNLVHVFFLSQRPKKALGPEAPPLPVDRAAVLGAGVMGGGIAQLLADRDIPVLLKDIREEAVGKGLDHARGVFRRQQQKRGGGEGAVKVKMGRIFGTTEYKGFGNVDLVIEAVVEKMSVKQAVLRDVEPLLPQEAVFATNTSALSVTELQRASGRPGQVAGLHFFNPAEKMPLVEVVRGEETSDRTTATLLAVAVRLGKTPILVDDSPGFLVNRLLMAYLNEAGLLAESGVDWTSLDVVAQDFGWPMGPFRLLDEVGIDIAAEVGGTLCRAFPYLPETKLLKRAADEGLTGRKGGEGFYTYHKGKAKKPNLAVDSKLGLAHGPRATVADLRHMIYLMVNEAARCLEEGVVAAPEDVDTGMVFGTGFPPFRGGLCRWADREGFARIRLTLEELEEKYGERFRPAKYLMEREGFYAAEDGEGP